MIANSLRKPSLQSRVWCAQNARLCLETLCNAGSAGNMKLPPCPQAGPCQGQTVEQLWDHLPTVMTWPGSIRLGSPDI